MQANAIVGIPARKQWRRRKSSERPGDVVNHLNRDFSASDTNSKWVTDITYVRTGEGWLYLAVVVDLCHGQVVGWSMSHRMETQLVIQAVLMALWQKKSRMPVILHSGRGSQFTSHEYQCFLKDHNITSSMSAVGSCYDNAAAESFFGDFITSSNIVKLFPDAVWSQDSAVPEYRPEFTLNPRVHRTREPRSHNA